MIIGRGMLATAFGRYRDHPDVVIFASGVSDSTETVAARFEREESLLVRTLEEHGGKQFIYFGTCSVADPEMSSMPYVRHKLEMEELIQSISQRHLIFRLPQVVGHGGNKNTIVNRLYENIRSGEKFQLWRNAYRYIIDVEDVSAIAGYMIDRQEYSNRIINIASRRFSIHDIVHGLESVVRQSGRFTEVDRGTLYEIDCRESHDVARLLDIHFDETYLERVIRKYFKV